MTEYDLTTKEGVVKLIDMMEAKPPIEFLDVEIRERFLKEGRVLNIDEMVKYKIMLKQYNRERDILKRLLAQAPYFNTL